MCNIPPSQLSQSNKYVRIVRVNSPLVHAALLESQQLRYNSALKEMVVHKSTSFSVRTAVACVCRWLVARHTRSLYSVRSLDLSTVALLAPCVCTLPSSQMFSLACFIVMAEVALAIFPITWKVRSAAAAAAAAAVFFCYCSHLHAAIILQPGVCCTTVHR